jgi:hypothetical protein
MFLDFDMLYKAGEDFWNGIYTINYPYPAVFFFALLALMPRDVALALFLSLSAIALIDIFKRRAVLWAAYAPIVFTFATGQVDLLFFWLAKTSTPISLGLMLLKPQLAMFVLPQMLNRKNLRGVIVTAACLFIAPTLIRPLWVVEWVRNIIAISAGDPRQTTLLVYPVVAAVVIAVRRDWKSVWASANPRLLHVYDLTMLAGKSLWMIPASWALFLIGLQLNQQWLITLLAIF